ncbi:MAG: EamA family transporter [Betaproteobacteria bacterium]|nr:EamA family transporter [Betaproteobacteria bacterium]
MPHTLNLRLVLLMLLPPLMWAGNAVVGRLMVGLVPPLQLNLLRWSLALLILLPLGWQAIKTAEQRAALWERRVPLAVLGLLGVGAYNALQYLALTTSTPLNVTLIAASSPLWMLSIGALFYGQKPGPRELVSAACSLAGVLLVLSRGDFSRLADIAFVPGDVMMIGAIISWCFYSWMLSKPPVALQSGIPKPSQDWAGFLLVQTLFGIGWSALSAGAEALIGAADIQWSAGVVAAVIFTALGPSLIAYRSWGIGVAQAGPALASLFANLTPLFAGLMQGALLGQWPQGYHLMAFGLIVGGIALSSVKRQG